MRRRARAFTSGPRAPRPPPPRLPPQALTRLACLRRSVLAIESARSSSRFKFRALPDPHRSTAQPLAALAPSAPAGAPAVSSAGTAAPLHVKSD